MNQVITLTRFAKLLAEKTSYKEEYCEQFASELFKLVKDSLKDEGSVTIKGLGRFMVDDDLELHFMADAALEEVVNAPFECFEAVELDDDLTEEQLAEAVTEEAEVAEVAEEAEVESEIAVAEDEVDMAAEDAEVEPEMATTEDEGAMAAEEAEVESEMAVAEDEVDEVTEDVEVEPKVAVAVAEVAAEITEEAEVASEMATAEAEAEPDVAGTKVTEVEERAMAEDHEAEGAVEPKRCRRWVWLAAGFLIGAAAGCAFGIFVYPQIVGKSEESVENLTKTTEPINEAEQSTAEEVEVTDAAVEDSDGTSEPEAEKADNAGAKAVEETPIITETVTSTNYLATMARRHYGRFEFWVYIYEENREKLGDPDKIEPKTVVVIPPAAKYGIDKDDPESVKRAMDKARELYAPYGK